MLGLLGDASDVTPPPLTTADSGSWFKLSLGPDMAADPTPAITAPAGAGYTAVEPTGFDWSKLGETLFRDTLADLVNLVKPAAPAGPTPAQLAAAQAAAKAKQQKTMLVVGGLVAAVVVGALVLGKGKA